MTRPASQPVPNAHVRLQEGAGLPSRIAVVGNYLPRQCGIANFATDLCEAISAECRAAQLFAVRVNDTESGYEYPARVRIALEQDDLSSYEQATDFLNFANFDLVCLQHEYGIFGGPAGSHILHLLRRLKMPVITTLHTVPREPNPDQRRVMEEIAALCTFLVDEYEDCSSRAFVRKCPTQIVRRHGTGCIVSHRGARPSRP